MSQEAVTLEEARATLLEAQTLLEEVRKRIEPERIELPDEEREEIRANFESLDDDALVGLYMAAQKAIEQKASGDMYDLMQRYTTFTSVLLQRFAPVEFANQIAVWSEHNVD